MGLAAAVGAADDGGTFGVPPAQLLRHVLGERAQRRGRVGSPQHEAPVGFFRGRVLDGPVNGVHFNFGAGCGIIRP